MSTTTGADIANVLWKALQNVAVENNDSTDEKITVNVSKIDDKQEFTVTKAEIVDFVTDQMHKFDGSNGIYYCSDHVEYTVIAREKYRPSLAPFVWPEEIPFTEQHKYKYSLSQISLGLFFDFLKDITLDTNFIVQNIFNNSFYMGIFNNSGRSIDLFDKEVNLYNIVDSLLQRSVKQYLMAIKIEPVDDNEKNKIAVNIKKYKKMAESAMFSVNLSNFHGFSLRYLEHPLVTITDSSNMKRINGNRMTAPHMVYNHDMLEIYTAGNWHDDPLVQFINYYQVAEYLFNYVPNELLFKKVQEKIANPKFSYTDKSDVLELSHLIAEMNRKNDKEVNSLKMVLNQYVTYDDLKKSLSDELISYYRDEIPYFLKDISQPNQIKFSINNLQSSDKVYVKMARRLYAVRNCLVHNKEGENHFNSLIDDESLKKEVPLMKVIAETVIIKYGTTI
ncbi:hypothetical protein [Limosilactobacillus fermentum]|uniref:hypothetical protein n=1 Tax=Limosilactobacillus fermentum TaxID=1613 RepID=UPI00232F5324|nr:hypothetical protein [Limosilactobacillus fermentum]WCE95974.1 hypothetical protein PMF18_08260 [Limosilactobacillus fermentum]